MLFILLLNRKVIQLKKSSAIVKKLDKHFFSCGIFILLFGESCVGIPVQLKINLVWPSMSSEFHVCIPFYFNVIVVTDAC